MGRVPGEDKERHGEDKERHGEDKGRLHGEDKGRDGPHVTDVYDKRALTWVRPDL